MNVNTVQYIPVGKLELDSENPRLPLSIEKSKQNIIDYIADSTAIEDLMSAIAENGFFSAEPLVAIKKDGDIDEYIVVEGNRRLTAVILLIDPQACTKPSRRMHELSRQAKESGLDLSTLPVLVCPSREFVLPFLGFRHITGVKQWDSLAKARYIKQLFDNTDKNKEPDLRYKEIARAIGSRKDFIRRNLDALAVYYVLERNDFFAIPELDEESIKFSVLSTALADEKISLYAGLSKFGDEKAIISTYPIISQSEINIKNLKNLVQWMFKQNDSGETRLGDSRNIRLLSKIVGTPIACKALEDGATLQQAYQLTSCLNEDFHLLVFEIASKAQTAAGMLANIDYSDDIINTIQEARRNLQLIFKTLVARREESEAIEDV